MSTVLITGANRGIGLALTETYAARGDEVLATCRNLQKTEDLQRLAAANPAVRIIALDVTEPDTITAAVSALGGATIDILINNAGTLFPRNQTSLDMDFDGWSNTFAVNTMGPLRVAQAFLANLRASGNGRIVTITSRMGSSASAAADHLAYRSTKAAVNRVMQGLAIELRGEGIIAIVMHPGWVRTAMGGRGAPLSACDSAEGIASVIDKLSAKDSGKFLGVDGRQIPW